MHLRQLASASLLVSAVSLNTAIAQAQITVYTNLSSFQSAAGATSVETFSNATAFNTTGAFGPNAYTGFSLTGDGNGNNIGIHTGSVSTSGPDTPIPAAFVGQAFFGWGNVAGQFIRPLTFTFSRPTTAFAFDWFNTDASDQYQIVFSSSGTVYTGPPFTFSNGTMASSGFFGVVSSVAMTSATVSVNGSNHGGYMSDEGFDNVRVSTTAAAAPEPSSYALLMVAALGTVILRGYRQGRKAA